MSSEVYDIKVVSGSRDSVNSHVKNELKEYPNFRSLFDFPFGQPNICFSEQQIELLIENRAKKVFSTYPVIKSDTSASYFHSIPLHSFNNTNARIWYNIVRKSFKI